MATRRGHGRCQRAHEGLSLLGQGISHSAAQRKCGVLSPARFWDQDTGRQQPRGPKPGLESQQKCPEARVARGPEAKRGRNWGLGPKA